MQLRIVFTAFAVVTAIGALVSLVAPAQYMGLYGIDPDTAAVVLLRVIGGIGIGLAVMAWLARDVEPSPARHAMVLGLTVANALAAIVLVFGALSGFANTLAWLPPAFYAAFAIAFAIAGRASMTPSVAPGASTSTRSG